MNQASFDLWREPWVQLETASGVVERMGLAQTLLRAHAVRGIIEMSPLCVVGVHRLLVAILQDMLAPGSTADLRALWRAGCFPEEAIERFGAEFGGRFDLFSPDAPFLQSAALPLTPKKDQRTKTVLFLHPDWPAQGEATHYRHTSDDDAALCPACVANGLVLQPAFAASGGSGIRPSINGVPPIYVLPQGETLFHSLSASLTTEAYQPKVADHSTNRAWWRRAPVVKEKTELLEVDYTQSLTFAARQVRLHPEPAGNVPCTRCGATAEWLVRTMVYQMGEARPKDAPLWMDPFVPFRLRKADKAAAQPAESEDGPGDAGDGRPVALRPQEGRALWRDYGTLFLSSASSGSIRPTFLNQFDEMLGPLSMATHGEILRFRCVGMRTDGKAKIFEWVDQGLDVPLELLHSEGAAQTILDGLGFAEKIGAALRFVWKRSFGADHDQHKALGQRMTAQYWSALMPPFQRFALDCSSESDPDAQYDRLDAWHREIVVRGERVFLECSEQLGDDAASLRQRVQGQAFCHHYLLKLEKESRNG